jgi:hypothetical protein
MKSITLFAPYYPKPEEFKTELDLIDSIGYKKTNNDTEKEDYSETESRVIKCARVLFVLMADDAYIGRLFQQIVLYLNFRIHQLSAQILFHAFEMVGERLLIVY